MPSNITLSSHAESILKEWFQKIPDWQKDLFVGLWGKKAEEQLISRAEKLIRQEYLGESVHLSPVTKFPEDISFAEKDAHHVLLHSISHVTGVGALSPENCLNFSDGLTVVYGGNGSGKSSYVRILKALENPVNSTHVFGNVYNSDNSDPEASVSFLVDDEPMDITWSKSSQRRYPLQIYDTDAAKQFVDKENEIVYEPRVLAAITTMASLLEQLSHKFDDPLNLAMQKVSSYPSEIADTAIIQEFNSVKSQKDISSFSKEHPWTPELNEELATRAKNLSESDPQKAFTEKKKQLDLLLFFKKSTSPFLNLISNSGCASFLATYTLWSSCKQDADTLSNNSQSLSVLSHFGSEQWRKMWKYSNEYLKLLTPIDTPPLYKNRHCVLCQQPLDDAAQERLKQFDAFASGQVMSAFHDAQDSYLNAKSLLKSEIKDKINLHQTETILENSGFDEDIQDFILSIYRGASERCDWLLEYNTKIDPDDLPSFFNSAEIAAQFNSFEKRINLELESLKNIISHREDEVKAVNLLSATRWTSENITYKRDQLLLSSIKTKCKTNALTTLKKNLSKLLITDAYVSRFENEMSLMDLSGQIKVELIEKSPKKGKSYHQISLRGAKSIGKHKNGEVLSEGEFRVVSLAAFLSDLSSWNSNRPFIFDDPITSLDHIFEDRVAKRLVQLSLERQVIVFTHRLAFVHLLDQSVDTLNDSTSGLSPSKPAVIQHIELRRSPIGYPNSTPTYLNRIKIPNAINNLINVNIPKIRKAQKAGDYEQADTMLQALAATFRNIIEQGIESDLLDKVVQRFHFSVSTLRLPALRALTPSDVTFFHNLMSKYSAFDHSHSIELNAPLPSVDDLESDMKSLKEWSIDYNKRKDSFR